MPAHRLALGPRGLAAIAVLTAVAWSVCARAQAYGDHIRDSDSDSAPTSAATPAPATPTPDPELPRAPEPPASPFGSRGQWVVTGASSIGLRSTTYGQGQASRFAASFSPGIDWFVARNLSLGATLSFATSDDKGYVPGGTLVDTKQTSSSGGLRLGYLLRFARTVSLWPRATAGYASIATTSPGATGVSATAATVVPPHSASHEGLWGSLDAPVVFEVTPRFFVAAVPDVTVDVSPGTGRPEEGGPHLSVGAGSSSGARSAGTIPPPCPATPTPTRRRRRSTASGPWGRSCSTRS